MRLEAILQFLNDPGNGWQSRSVGAFVRYAWPRSEPPRWRTTTDALRDRSSRTFLGNVPANAARRVDKALGAVEKAVQIFGLLKPGPPPCHVVLWDPVFPLPAEWDLPELPLPPCPVTIIPTEANSSPLILVLTHDQGRFGGHEGAWLESSAIHEGFHALLARWLGGAALRDLQAYGWPKFEEMCAVAMESMVLPRNKAWMDYGRAWQASLSLSHCNSFWSAFLDSADGNFVGLVDREEYGHFALLNFLNEQVWPERERKRHWLPTVWEAAREGQAASGPWSVLQRELSNEGGVSALFVRYVKEAAFPSKKDGVLAHLHKSFGPPATAALARGDSKKIFALGPMAAQLLTCRLDPRTNGGFVQIVNYLGREDPTVLAFRVGKEGPIRLGVPVEVPRGRIRGKTKVWKIPVQQIGSKGTDYLFAVCQPNHAGRSLVFTAEYR